MFPTAAEAGMVAIFYNDAGGDKKELIKCCRRAGFKKVQTAADQAASEALMRKMMADQDAEQEAQRQRQKEEQARKRLQKQRE